MFGVKSRRAKYGFGLLLIGAAIAAVIFGFASRKGTEAERVEEETLAAGERLRVMNFGTAGAPILMKIDFGLRNTFGGESARDHYVEKFNRGMERLLELGVLEKRSFTISNTNDVVNVMRSVPGGITPIWSVAPSVDGKVVVVTAKKEEMGRWEALMRKFDTNAAVADQ